MRKIKGIPWIGTKREGPKLNEKGLNVGIDGVRIVTYENALDMALKVLEESY